MSPGRRPPRGRGVRGRRVRTLLLVCLGALAVVALTQQDRIGNAVRELTLPLRHEDIIRQQAADKGVPADLVAAVIYHESRFRDQTSSAGARGLMQITPETAEIIEDLSGGTSFEQSDLADPDINIRYGTFYLRHLLDKFEGREVAALAAYNAGETNVAAWGGSGIGISEIEFPETRAYVRDVLERRQQYRETYADELGL